MINKSDISGFISNSDLNKKIATQTKNEELKAQQDKIIKIEVLSHFKDGGTEN